MSDDDILTPEQWACNLRLAVDADPRAPGAAIRLDKHDEALRDALATVTRERDGWKAQIERDSAAINAMMVERDAAIKRAERAEALLAARRPKPVDPPPRYDEVFAEGTRWLDSLAGPPQDDD